MYRPSNYIQSFDTIQAGDKIRLWCRVSDRKQNTGRNNEDQNKSLRAEVEAKGATVVGVSSHVGFASGDRYYSELEKACRLARRQDAKLVAECTSRFVRHPDFKPTDKRLKKPGIDELHTLRFVSGDVPLVTLYDPDLRPEQETSYQTKRGMNQKNRHGGRKPKKEAGYKKQRKEENLPEVLRFHRDGMGKRAIGKKLGIAESTVRSWIEKFQ